MGAGNAQRPGTASDRSAELVAEAYRAEIERAARLIAGLEERIVRAWARVERDGAEWGDVVLLREVNARLDLAYMDAPRRYRRRRGADRV